MNPFLSCCGLVLALTLSASARAQTVKLEPLQVDQAQVQTWNRFADALYTLHRQRLEGRSIRTTERIGGYVGDPEFYREVHYIDARTGLLLSRIQWERKHPERIHMIEVLIHDRSGRVERDYLAAYLPDFRNAPVQTLINFHHYEDGLHGFRQFDASGNRIYEQCGGTYFGKKVFLSLEEDELPPYAKDSTLFDSDVYLACFEYVPLRADGFLDPLAEIRSTSAAADDDRQVAELTRALTQDPGRGELYLQRGQRYFERHEFESALQDFDAALLRDAALDEAYFWRGMALGRMGQLDAAIAAMDIYLARHPKDSRALTKRGVRHIWNGELEKAEQDLAAALAVDDRNAEAHDDLGVLFAQRRQFQAALAHFQRAVTIEPSYQKAHHNSAMVLYLTGHLEPALQAANESQRLAPNDRNTLLLKSQILQKLGRTEQARALLERAQFMPEEKDWTEQFQVQ